MTGPLSPAQASLVLHRLESGIQQQYQARLEQVNRLPPERQALALFNAQTERDRMRVTAYRNVLGRLTHPCSSSGFPMR